MVEDLPPRITTYSDVYAFGAVAMEVRFPLSFRENGHAVLTTVSSYLLRF